MKSVMIFMIRFVVIGAIFGTSIVFAGNQKVIDLPQPRQEGGMPLMQALKERQSTRSYADKELSNQVLSNLLWAAFGINRPGFGKRTAPSARNWQDLEIYIAKKDGVFIYDAPKNQLKQISTEDMRQSTGEQPFVKTAPINLVYVSDFTKMKGNDDQKRFLSATHAGFVGQNVYLFCASEKLATVVRAMVDRGALAKKFALKPEQHITLVQSVGYPAK